MDREVTRCSAQRRFRSLSHSTTSLIAVALTAWLTHPAYAAPHYRHVQTLMASDAEPDDLFGTVVDLDGDTAIVRSRAPYGGGKSDPQTHVFVMNSSGLLTESSIITQPVVSLYGSNDFPWFIGQETALDGDTIVSGQSFGWQHQAPRSVTFNTRTANEWPSEPQLLDFDPREIYSIWRPGLRTKGRSVAISGDTALAADPTGIFQKLPYGGVHVYQRNPEGHWGWDGVIVPDEINRQEGFGYAVGLDGNTAIVTARKRTSSPDPVDSSAIYFYERDEAAAWNQSQRISFLRNSDIAPEWWAGDKEWSSLKISRRSDINPVEVIIEDDTAVVRTDACTTLVFRRLESSSTNGGIGWVATNAFEDNYLSIAKSIDLDGNFLAMGTGERREAGSVLVYRRDAGGTWKFFDEVFSPDASRDLSFGASVSIDNGNLLVGSSYVYSYNFLPDKQAGAAFLFTLVPEPSSAILLAIAALAGLSRSRFLVRRAQA